MFVSLARACVTEVVSCRHAGGLGQLMGVAHKRTRTQKLEALRRNVELRNWN